jgi:hypothetical protein
MSLWQDWGAHCGERVTLWLEKACRPETGTNRQRVNLELSPAGILLLHDMG